MDLDCSFRDDGIRRGPPAGPFRVPPASLRRSIADGAPACASSWAALFPLVGSPLVKLMWFRGERVRLVTWAGNPDKATALMPDGRVGPRRSFEAWTETVRLRGLPWTAEEVESARYLTALVDIELLKTVEDALRLSMAEVARLKDALYEAVAALSLGSGALHPLSLAVAIGAATAAADVDTAGLLARFQAALAQARTLDPPLLLLVGTGEGPAPAPGSDRAREHRSRAMSGE